MSVAVYPRLSELLEAQRMSVAELERQIAKRFGLSVDAEALYRLSQPQPVQQADMEAAGAAAAVLGVGLDDLFQVHAVPIGIAQEGTEADAPTSQSGRLSALLDRQSREELTSDERQELDNLVHESGRREHEHRLQEVAAARGVTVEQVRAQVASELEQAEEWWREFEADPRRRRGVIARSRRERRKVVRAAQ